MSIAEFQRAFADLIAFPHRCVALREGNADVLAGYDMTRRERKRLETMVHDEAMSVNCSLYRVNRLIPVYSVLPHSCRLLGNRLMVELDAFWAASRHATLQYRWESWRFGLWLEERIAARRLPGGPVEDAIRLEMALFDAQAAASGGNGGSRLATLPLTLAKGKHLITAAYSGDVNWKTAVSSPVARFQNRMVPSRLVETRVRPSCEKAMPTISSSCPLNIREMFPVCTSQTVTVSASKRSTLTGRRRTSFSPGATTQTAALSPVCSSAPEGITAAGSPLTSSVPVTTEPSRIASGASGRAT